MTLRLLIVYWPKLTKKVITLSIWKDKANTSVGIVVKQDGMSPTTSDSCQLLPIRLDRQQQRNAIGWPMQRTA